MEIETEWVKIPVGDHKMRAYLARPKDAKTHPGVLVFQEIFGVNSHIRDVAERVAREGYVALAPELFHRTAPELELGYEPKDFGKGLEHMSKAMLDHVLLDIYAAKNFLEHHPASKGHKTGAMGFCFGGHVTYLAATDAGVAAAASFYGGGIAMGGPGTKHATVDRTPNIKGKILCFFGEKDAYIAPDQIKKIEGALKAANIEHEVHVYKGADHGFFCDQRGTHNADAAKDSWEKVKKLFREKLN